MIRGVGLRGAIAVNVITMIGIGPLITIPLVVSTLHGGLALIGWAIGAVIALCDGLVWAELSSRFPGSGGTYVYLREAFGRDRWGRLFAFLFNWQFLFYAPLLLASGYIGFAQYAAYFFPAMNGMPWIGGAVRIGLGVVVIALLYQRITGIAKLSIVLGVAAVTTLLCVIAASLPHANFAQALSTDMSPGFNVVFLGGLGLALVNTVYDYVGYADVALIGDEVVAPNKTIPIAIVLSVLLVAVLYIAMQIGVLGVVPWRELIGKNGVVPDSAQYVASTVIEHTWGRAAALAVTVLVLITAFASLYGNLLGFSRIPFAAARDGIFFPIFRRLHPTGAFPNVSLLVIGVASIAASFWTLGDVITYLTAGIVLIQGVAQVVAIAVFRTRREAPPFRMWLFPLPALIALAGWLYLFIATGNRAMLFGVVTLAAGAVAFALLARAQRTWPFVAAIVAALTLFTTPSAQASYGHSRVAQQNGYPVFEVDGKPFFVYGAAFFYERLPKSQWRSSLKAYKALGINTIDLYLIWNWHELADGDFDFTGRTNPRRDLHALLAMIHELGFKTIVRPGPVIRNEWKNGGYPDWLLERPDYNMPLHDVLEGRYPATATLQNAHSDDAAAEWMNNKTHMRYAPRWLRRVLTEIKPWSSDVIAIALDDDQGAYIDNQTWPAPHFQAYIKFLDSVVHTVAAGVPTFINTYQMKVTASSPVWAWGNWYQSDAYSIGEHDRSQLEFSTALLQTQPNYPVMVSEFQAGWLQGPDENEPRPADPSNTELALGSFLQMGAHGIVNFPVQDTFNPPGYEAPFANAYYGWDAALSFRLRFQARYPQTKRLGRIVSAYGNLIAQTHPDAHVAIVWPASVATSGESVYKMSASAIATLQACRASRITCDFLDPRFATTRQRSRYLNIVALTDLSKVTPGTSALANSTVLLSNTTPHYAFLVIANYGESQSYHDVVVALPEGPVKIPNLYVDARATKVVPLNIPLRALNPTAGRFDTLVYSTCIAAPAAPGGNSLQPFDDYTGCGFATRTISGERTMSIRTITPMFSPEITSSSSSGAIAAAAIPQTAQLRSFTADAYDSGFKDSIIQNRAVRVIVSPDAGARAFVFSDLSTGRNVFSSVGAFRDDVASPVPPSGRDYIAKYTHQLAAGTFNRPYAATPLEYHDQAAAVFTYRMPDASGGIATFEKTVLLPLDGSEFSFSERARLSAGASGDAVSVSALTVDDLHDAPERCFLVAGSQVLQFRAGTALDVPLSARWIALYDSGTHQLATIRWEPDEPIARIAVQQTRGNAVVRFTYAPERYLHLHFGSFTAPSQTDALALLASLKGR